MALIKEQKNEDGSEIQVNGIYKDKNGLRYKVEGVIQDSLDIEKGKAPKKSVLYSQLDVIENPTGTSLVRDEKNFLENFTKVEN